jgi:hypothetical protein
MKRLFWGVTILSMLFLSCLTPKKAGTVFDESVPLERSAWISASNLGTIVAYNGIAVNWKDIPFSPSLVQIPAGDTLIEVNVRSENGNTIYTGDGLIFRYNFQPGKLYLFLAKINRETNQFGLNVFAWNIGETVGTYSEKNLEAFVPFLNAAGNNTSGEKTVLE